MWAVSLSEVGLLLLIACFRGWVASEVDFVLELLASNDDVSNSATLYTRPLYTPGVSYKNDTCAASE